MVVSRIRFPRVTGLPPLHTCCPFRGDESCASFRLPGLISALLILAVERFDDAREPLTAVETHEVLEGIGVEQGPFDGLTTVRADGPDAVDRVHGCELTPNAGANGKGFWTV